MLLSQTLPEGSYKKNTLDLPHAQQLIGNSMEKSHYHIGEVEFNVQDKNLVFNRYRSVKLTNRETLILQYLLECPNQAITLTEIIQKGLVQHPSDPIATRKIIQALSTKLELADRIEYPYVDCYMFRCLGSIDKKPSIFSFQGIKRLLGRNPQTAKTCVS